MNDEKTKQNAIELVATDTSGTNKLFTSVSYWFDFLLIIYSVSCLIIQYSIWLLNK